MEKPKAEGQDLPAVLRFLDDHADLFRRRGSVRATWRTRRGKSFGPFYELRYREGSRLVGLYLGRSAELAEQVRARLRQMQAARREALQWRRTCKQHRAIGRELKANLNRELQRVGLRLHGFEVRGMRTGGLPAAASR